MLKTTNEKINSKSNICYLMLNYPEVLLACGKVITNKAGTNIPDLTITQPDEIGFSKHGTYFKTTSVVSKKISNMVNIGFFSLFYAINLEKVFSILIINMKQVGDYFNNLLINKYTLYNLFIDNGFARSELSFFDNSVINCWSGNGLGVLLSSSIALFTILSYIFLIWKFYWKYYYNIILQEIKISNNEIFVFALLFLTVVLNIGTADATYVLYHVSSLVVLLIMMIKLNMVHNLFFILIKIKLGLILVKDFISCFIVGEASSYVAESYGGWGNFNDMFYIIYQSLYYWLLTTCHLTAAFLSQSTGFDLSLWFIALPDASNLRPVNSINFMLFALPESAEDAKPIENSWHFHEEGLSTLKAKPSCYWTTESLNRPSPIWFLEKSTPKYVPNVTGLVPVTQPLYKNWKMAGIAGRPSSIIPSGFYIHNDFVMSNYDKQAAIIEGINRHNRPNCYNHSHIRDVLRFEEVFDEYGLHAGTRLAPPGFNSYIKYMYLSNIPEYMTFNEVTGRLEPKFPLIRPATPLEESTYLFKRNILTPNNKQRMAVFFMDCNDRQLQQLGLTLKKASGLLRPSVVEPEAEINYKSSNLTLARLEEYRSKLSSSSSDTYRPEMYSDRKAMTYGTEPSVPSSVAIPSAIRAIFAKAYGEGVCSGKLYDEKISSFSYNYNVFSKELDSVWPDNNVEASTLKAEQLKHYAIVTIALADFEYKTSNNLSLKMEPALYRQYIFDAKLQFFKEYNHIISNCRTVPAGLRKNIDEVFAKLERML